MHKTWFITGAASRLASDIAKAALAQGDFVFATDGEGGALAAAFAHSGACSAAHRGRLQLRPLDVADGRAVAAAMDEAADHFGGLDVVVHGEALRGQAGASGRWPGTSLVRGVFNVTRTALPLLRERGGGRIHHLVPAVRAGDEKSMFSIAGFCAAVATDVVADGIAIDAVAPAEAHARLFAPWAQGEDQHLEEA